MKLALDSQACMGHGRCYGLAPDLFDADDQGHSILTQPQVAPGQEQQARIAAESCPEEAITVDESAESA
jgi:ferredoxin